MTTLHSTALGEFVGALVARDFDRARSQLHEEIDFRAMTPNRIWEADGPGGVEDVLRNWLADPEEEIESVAVVDQSGGAGDTERTGWLVHGRGEDGPFVYEQQAYARERDGKIGWLRVMCTGQRPPGA